MARDKTSKARVTMEPVRQQDGRPLDFVSTADLAAAIAGAGTVTSVGLAAPAMFTVSGSPVIAAGVLTLALATQAPNLLFAGPAAGPNAAPTFRAMAVADLVAHGNGSHTVAFMTAADLAAAIAAIYPINLATQVTGTLPVGKGGTGTATAFTAGSIVFAGPAGVYAQDNANLFWDDANNRLGVGIATPAVRFHSSGGDVYLGDEANAARSVVMRRTAVAVGGFNTAGSVFNLFGGTSLLASDHLSIASNGYVGVGTNVPLAKFHAHRAAADSVEMANAAFIAGDFTYGVGLVGQQTLSAPFAFVLQVQSSPLAGSVFPLSLNPRGGGVFMGSPIVMHLNGAAQRLDIGAVGDTGSTSEIRLFSTSARYNWQIANGVIAANVLTLTPSTAVNGTTFSTPAVAIDATTGIFSTPYPMRVNGMTGGSLGVKASGTAFSNGFMVEASANDSVLEILFDGSVFKLDSSYRSVAGYKPLTIHTSSVERMRFDIVGNVLIGASVSPSTGTKALIFGDGTIPATMGSNTAAIYADDVGGTVEMFGINEAGQTTRLTGRTTAYTPTNVTTDRAYDANATTLDEVADVLGTLIADLQTRGILG